MWRWLRGFDWLPLTLGALVLVLGFNILSWTGFPVSGHVVSTPMAPGHAQVGHGGEADVWVAVFTATLTVSTLFLWASTADLARDARDSSRKLLKMETPYVTGGGDFVSKDTGGVELFRLDVENHGKTPAFMIAYDLQFATLAELREEERKGKKARGVCKTYRHIEGLSPLGGRREIFTQIPMKAGADVVYGAVWYDDPILAGEHHSRFILRIAPTRDIRGHGLTRVDVEDVSRGYWSWDYRDQEPEHWG